MTGDVCMISEEQLRMVLKNNSNISAEFINRFLKKKIKSVYNLGRIENIEKIIELLNKYNMLSLFEQCSTILAQGKIDDIKKIIYIF